MKSVVGTTTVGFSATMKEKNRVLVKFTRTIKRRRFLTNITRRINHYTTKQRRNKMIKNGANMDGITLIIEFKWSRGVDTQSRLVPGPLM